MLAALAKICYNSAGKRAKKMKLISVTVDNYRNLGELEFSFNDDLNFIIGENNLGKSNFIDLLEVLFNRTRFEPSDFFTVDAAIKIAFQVKLNDSEKNIFGIRENVLSVLATQKNADSNIAYINAKNNTEIPVEAIRCINFFRDESIPGQILQFSFSRFEHLQKIQSYYYAEYGDIENLEVSEKFLLALEFSILEKIYAMSKTRQEKIKSAYNKHYIEQILYGSESAAQDFSQRYELPMLLAFDELEIRLHPYMQRSLVRALSKIVNNENSFFCRILKKEFGIERLSGQLFIVTHSPNILLNNYKQFVRFYKANGNSAVVCGKNIHVKNDKHLFKNFIYFKEAFFAKFVIVVEGDSEFAAIPEFAEKILNGKGFDSYGVSLIKADGKTSVNLVMNILQAFKINSLGMVDRDDDDISKIQARLKHPPYLYTTQFRDFEEELLEKLGSENFSLLDRFLFLSDSDKRQSFYRTLRDEVLCKKKCEKYGIALCLEHSDDESALEQYFDDKNALKLFYLSELNRRKGISFWHELGFELPKEYIPDIYKKIIVEATSN